jgi:hypothetical protein
MPVPAIGMETVPSVAVAPVKLWFWVSEVMTGSSGCEVTVNVPVGALITVPPMPRKRSTKERLYVAYASCKVPR